MMKKIKKIIMPLMLGAFLFGGVATEMKMVEPVSVYAEGSDLSGDATNMPTIKFEGDSLTMGGLDKGDKKDFFNTVLTEYRTVVIFVSGIGTISMILFFILNFINLGKSQGNPQERQKAITGLIISGIASAGLGSVTLIVSLFYNVLAK